MPDKDRYRLGLASLSYPVILLNQQKKIDLINRAATEFLSRTSPGFSSSRLPHWLQEELDAFVGKRISGMELEKRLTTPSGNFHLQLLFRKLKARTAAAAGILITIDDLNKTRFTEECLREMVHGISEATGEAFFQFLAIHLARITDADHALIGELCGRDRSQIRTVAISADGALLENFNYELAGTPCETVIKSEGVCCYPRGVRHTFPMDHLAFELEVESYMGIPLIDAKGEVLGLLALFSRKPFLNQQLAESMLQVFAGRATAELERLQAEETLKESKGRLKTIVDSVQTGIILIEAESRRIVDVNDVAVNMIGQTRHRLLGAICHNYICPQPSGSCPVIDQGKTIENCESLLLTERGHRLPVLKNVAMVTLNGREHLLESFVDISDRKRAEDEIQNLAYYDTLTGLPNRTFLQERLGKTLIGRPRPRPFAVMFLDLDKFKDINDTLGHVFGDCMLKEVANRLTGCIRKNDTVLRLGGDEFVVILSGVEKEADITTIARKILNILSEPIIIDEHEIFSTGSIGIALYPADGRDVETLLKHADTAMYRAKDQGRNNYQFFSREMSLQAMEQRQLESFLRHALKNDEFSLAYQPQLELKSGRIVGVEALLRWHHQEQGILLPETFVAVAEKTGLIIPIGEWVLRAACRQGRKWQQAGFPVLRIAVNLSGRQFKQYNLLGTIDEILRETGFDPTCLELELTESTLMDYTDMTVQTLKGIKNMGITLSIDDFGKGYSSLSHLKQFPIDRLKIDRSFIRDVTSNSDDAAIAEAIIAMGHSLKLRVIAEGVERQDQIDFLASRQCDEIQGFLLSPPLSVEKITAFLEQQKKQDYYSSFSRPSRSSPLQN